MTGDSNDAQEVLQEVFLTVLEKMRTLREPGSFLPWVFTTAKNLCYLLGRRGKIQVTPGAPVCARDSLSVPEGREQPERRTGAGKSA
ncbi:MAG: hypothetical protein HYY65_04150 [Candidatus Tectomicrobia bacterium]|uniref:RNA polymerase sigma-70 region 2 domain-containing protein n=1 Tax=Tectimicrobiota bacterium TaxID=2528274 RepID=A0A932GNE6_UNCTE|nr:hypothetical protein [Candidatus Tectomicrobia bacterium]